MTLRAAFPALLLVMFGLSLYAAPCEMDPAGPAQHVFAQVDANHPWTEFSSIEALPKLSLDGGVSAQVWKLHDGGILVKTAAPASHYWTYTTSCYSRTGTLDDVAFELRTDWGWYYKAEGPVVFYRFHRTTENFFNSKTDQPLVVRPEQPDDNPKMMTPMLYLRPKLLPFADLLGKLP